MIPEIIEKWNKNKHFLENFFKTHAQKAYSDNYTDFLKIVMEHIINDDPNELYDLNKLHVIDDGDYQGTIIFLIPKDTYQPSLEDYLMTHVYYGSCSGCDTLQSIHCYNNDLEPDQNQLSQYMTLALHLIQQMKNFKDEE